MIKRESNVELLRFVSMLLVLFLHCNFLSCGGISIEALSQKTVIGSLRIFLESSSLVCVNVFILISGWFGIKNRKKATLNILYQTILVTFICGIIAWVCDWSIDGIRDFSGYWFLIAYLGLLILSPILNFYLDYASKSDCKIFLISYGLLIVFCGWLYDIASFHRGFSFAFFIWLYLLSGYIHKYLLFWVKKYSFVKWFFIYLALSLFNGLLYYCGIVLNNGFILFRWAQYINPLVISASLALFFSFTRLSFSNNFVNYLGSSAFLIYLIHTNGFVWHHFLSGANSIYTHLSGICCVLLMLLYIWGIIVAALVVKKIYQYANSLLH